MSNKKSFKISIDSVKSSDVTIVGPGNISFEEDEEYSLASGINRLANAIQERYSLSSGAETAELTNVILNKISDHIESGDQIAFLHKNEDNSYGLTTLTLKKGK